ncbi:hypothetical protein PoB_006431700 [Plakobranchus ocellatus]|uniref:RNase H type-1 domain-containing protein n=1 Tax=Plakobranchus ocellatus TaxID=259542 RepID=A0AAV4D0Y7_9GAST|nr:hypothetical protein PoB_006431700 [Plakobranchus ocellatus]
MILGYSFFSPLKIQRETVEIVTTIKGIENKAIMSLEEMYQVANKEMNNQYPQNQWVRFYADESATKAIKNEGLGVHVERQSGTTETHSFPTGTQSSNYKAEAVALEHAVSLVKNSFNTA